MEEPFELDVAELGRRYRDRTLSPVEVERGLAKRIARLDRTLGAFTALAGEEALAAARLAEAELAAGIDRGPLHGIPVTVKDLCLTRDMPTTVGLRGFAQRLPRRDAAVVAQLRAAGAVLIGKTYTTAGAFVDPAADRPFPRQPWRDDIFPGMSSTGAGVAVAAGFCSVAIGTDTGGSIRLPSLCCGVSGLKPAYGRVDAQGVFESARSFDHVGPMARSVADLAAAMTIIGRGKACHPVADLAGVRLGIDRRELEGTGPKSRAAIERAIDLFVGLGVEAVEVAMPPVADLLAVAARRQARETASVHAAWYPLHVEDYGPGLAATIERGWSMRPEDLEDFDAIRAEYGQRLDGLFGVADLIILPVLTIDTPTTGEWAAAMEKADPMGARFTKPFNVTGHPTLALPAGFDEHGLPLGFQLIGRPAEEALLLGAGMGFQRISDWHRSGSPSQAR
ncbi:MULTISPECIES: amidase [unclassified Sphingomonas]|uniref:amidase n=1 Tax=unclassified Sphingomonas TaxID=196159 RepID=UPI0006F407E5|nr:MULTISPECIES: amidase [unclassified Sphingomonas]KQX17993.1 amidase [Sphingomonas sp. Root1294]KQY70918.1 amidase [Sphingomonas sp. Root50]KRB91584.1 amidase [Sphingomonas sp. Root720]